MNIRSKVNVKVRVRNLADRVAGVSYAPLSIAPLVVVVVVVAIFISVMLSAHVEQK